MMRYLLHDIDNTIDGMQWKYENHIDSKTVLILSLSSKKNDIQ